MLTKAHGQGFLGRCGEGVWPVWEGVGQVCVGVSIGVEVYRDLREMLAVKEVAP